MLIPDWLFILLAIFSISLFLILVTCLICVVAARRRHQVKYKTLRKSKDGKKDPRLAFSPYDEAKYTYIPYTTPYTIQSVGYRSSSIAGSTGSDLAFQSPPAFLQGSTRRKADPFDRTPDERYQGRQSLKDHDSRRFVTPHLQTQADMKIPSRASSRKSSIGSIHSLQTEDTHSQKGVYLHSSLTQTLDADQTDGDALVSYDQDFKETRKLKRTGRLEFTLYYDPVATELIVTIRRAINLPVEEGKETLNPYINFCIVPEDFYWQRTTTAENTRHPRYDETFHIPDVLHHKLREYTVCFLVMDSDKIHGDRAIGRVMVSLSDLRAGVNVEMTKEIAE